MKSSRKAKSRNTRKGEGFFSRMSGSPKGDDADRVNMLEAENLFLQDEVDRLRLALSGAHPAMAAADVMAQDFDPCGQERRSDETDDLVSLKVQTMAARSELMNLIGLMQQSLQTYEKRLSVMEFDAEPAPVEAQAPRPARTLDQGGHETFDPTATIRIPVLSEGGRLLPGRGDDGRDKGRITSTVSG